MTFLSTPSARRATCSVLAGLRHRPISIHALREEGDYTLKNGEFEEVYFYPRPPRGGRLKQVLDDSQAKAISIHALREEGDPPTAANDGVKIISIHALREEGDLMVTGLPTPLVISIHALREEGDRFAKIFLEINPYFYPRPPRGGRRKSRWIMTDTASFLSTPSARRATIRPNWCKLIWSDFYPRPPRGGRPQRLRPQYQPADISIHALREEGDTSIPISCRVSKLFLSTPSARRATSSVFDSLFFAEYFYPRPPRGGRPIKMPRKHLTHDISIHALREEGDLIAAYPPDQ